MGDDGVARSSLDTELWGAYDWRRMPAGGIYLSLVCTYGRSIPPRGSIERTTYSWYLFPPE